MLLMKQSGQRSAATARNRFAFATFAASFLLASSAVGADAGDASDKTDQPKPTFRSVEEIAAKARKSVAVVSHHGRDGRENGVGSGFVISSNGLIATSLHVIGEARPIAVRLEDGRRLDVVEVYAWDRKLDLAIIRVDAKELPELPLGDSDGLTQGERVVAIGNPLGLEYSVVEGIVSARRDFEGLEMIQLAIPIEPGNSGGPLLDLEGGVQGILNMKSAMTANLGFATPINLLKPLLEKPNPVRMSRWLTIGNLNPKEWEPLFGARWSRKSGQIRVEEPGRGFGGRSLCLYQREVPDRPYEIAVTVRLEDESGAAGLVFGSDGGQKHYGFYPTAGQLRLTRFDGPTVFNWTILNQTKSDHYRPEEWNTIKVRHEKDRILCYVNGQLVIESRDDGLPLGKAGLAKFRDTKAAFKDFAVGKEVEPPQPAPTPELLARLNRRIDDLLTDDSGKAMARLGSHPDLARMLLSDRARHLEAEAKRMRLAAAELHQRSVQNELVEELDQPEETIDLFRAALLVARLDQPELEVAAYQTELEEMARTIQQNLASDADPHARLEAVRKYLFDENGFHGSRTDYYNRANSYMNSVLDDREGLPITLSVLFIELARQSGVSNVFGVPLPGHFVVKHAPVNGNERFIDVFDGGRLLSRGEIEELVWGFTGRTLREEHLRKATSREIIVRMLRNLLGIAERNGLTDEALRYLDTIIALAPEEPLDRLNRALLRIRAGDPARAKEDLEWLIDEAPDGLDLDRIAELYRSLTNQ